MAAAVAVVGQTALARPTVQAAVAVVVGPICAKCSWRANLALLKTFPLLPAALVARVVLVVLIMAWSVVSVATAPLAQLLY